MLPYYDADTGCSQGVLKGCSRHVLLFLSSEDSKSANNTYVSIFFMPFCLVSSRLWFVSIFVLGKFLTEILLFHKQIIGPSGDQNIDRVGKNLTNEIAPPGQYLFSRKSFLLLL